MGFVKNFMKLLETIPASKPILHQIEEIVHSLQRSCPSAKSKDLKQQVINAKNQYNKEVAAMERAYKQEITGGFEPLDKIIKDNISLNKPKTKPKPYPTGGNPSGGGNNSGHGGPMLGGGGLGPLW